MRFPDQHLSADEIELLAGEGDRSDDSPSGLNEAREHVEVCEQCRQILSAQQDLAATMELLRNPGGARKQADCPPLDIWLQVAGGTLSANENDAYLDHAAQCDYCGEKLREICKDFGAPPNSAEQAELDHLATIPFMGGQSPRLAHEKAPNANKATFTARTQRKLIWGFAAAAILICSLVGALLYRHSQQNEFEEAQLLLTKSYTARRPLELRMPGAAFSEWKGLRGQANETERPPELDEANLIIKKKIAQYPKDIAWLQLEGRARLLSWDYKEANKIFDDALSIKPNDTSLLIDQATALFERAAYREDGRKADLAKAAENLERALKVNPADPVVLFNLAIIYEKLDVTHVAISRWQQYLAIDSHSDWSKEASSHLQELEEKTLQHDKESMKPVLPVHRLLNIGPDELADLKGRVEQYQKAALTEWLPSTNVSDWTEYYIVVDKLAAMLRAQHADPWMHDLLMGDKSKDFISGLQFLRKALIETDKGSQTEAFKDSLRSVSFFKAAKNQAGELRARAEVLHDLQRMQNGGECLKQSKFIDSALAATQYHWLRGQFEIERASCALKTGAFDLARLYINEAAKETAFGYPALHMRLEGITAAIETDGGNVVAAWQIDERGLEQFWHAKNGDPVRAQQFYDDLTYVAEDMGLFHVAAALAEENVSITGLLQDVSAQALSRQHLATFKYRLGEITQASAELDQSQYLLEQLDKNDGARIFGEINLARLKAEQGAPNDAENELKLLRPKLAELSSFPIALDFFKVSGELHTSQNRLKEAEKDYRDAIDLADLNLANISEASDRKLWNQEIAPIYRALVDLELRLEQPSRALAVWEWYLSAPIRPLPIAVSQLYPFSENIHFPELLHISRDGALLVYIRLPTATGVWVITSTNITYRIIEAQPVALDRGIQQFFTLCSDPHSDLKTLKIRAHELYKYLISPIEPLISNRNDLMVELDPAFSSLPFQALIDPNERYLCEKFYITYSYGQYFRFSARNTKSLNLSSRAVIVNSSAAFPEQLPIPDAEKEADMVSTIFHNSLELENDQANKAAVEKQLEFAELFHYIGHALSDVGEEGIVLRTSNANSAPLLWNGAGIAKRAFRHCRLIVLSACSTGRYSASSFEERGALLDLFLRKGVPALIVSRWDVDSGSSFLLMRQFYTHLARKADIAKALTDAERNLLAQRNTEHPFYWAAFYGIFSK